MTELNLYWQRTSPAKTINLTETPFKSEEAFEKYIFQNSDLLEDLYLIKRQVRSGQRQGTPDIVGVDQDGHICIVEMKNAEVSQEILPQVLQYAMWAESNPDSIKALWLEDKNKPDDLTIDWDNPDVRVLVVAPAFRPSVLRMSVKINYEIDFLEVKRFVLENDEFLLISRLSPEEQPKPKSTRGLAVYNREFYESHHDKEAVGQFLRVTEAIEKLVRNKGWHLQRKFNKYYAGFKYGNRLCFGVAWQAARAWNLFFKVPESAARNIQGQNWEFQRYYKQWKQINVRCIDPRKTDVAELEELFEAAHENIVGV